MVRFIFALFTVLILAACGEGWDVGPNDGGHVFNKRFYYYYSEYCAYDSFGPYNCEGASSMSSYMWVGLRIDRDGMATLTLDGDSFVFLPGEYSEGYDYSYGGDYFQFYEDNEEITVYTDGFEMIFVDELNDEAIYYYADLPF